jgi:hypothetical protein
MKLQILNLLILAAPSVAFYPYSFPTSDIDLSSLRKRQHITFPIRRVKRSNGFAITKANTPSVPNTVGVDQDGSDLSYMVEVAFGSSKKLLYLLLDSAAVNTWVMGSSCTSVPCSKHNTFGPSDSTTLQTSTATFAISYGSGNVNGTIATDTVGLLGKSVQLTFGLAGGVSNDFSDYPMDGILGVGRLGNVVNNPTGVKAPTIVDVFASQGIITPKLIGIRLSRTADKLNNGELSFGAPDPSAYVAGTLNYIPAMNNSNGFWEIPLTGAGFNGVNAVLQPNITILLDTGTSYMLLPPADATALHALIPGAKGNDQVYTIPCNTNQPLTLNIGGQTYNISPEDYVGYVNSDGSCTSNIVGQTTFSANQWLVGDVFLKNVYTVLDYDGSRVGLAPSSSKFFMIISVQLLNSYRWHHHHVTTSQCYIDCNWQRQRIAYFNIQCQKRRSVFHYLTMDAAVLYPMLNICRFGNVMSNFSLFNMLIGGNQKHETFL